MIYKLIFNIQVIIINIPKIYMLVDNFLNADLIL